MSGEDVQGVSAENTIQFDTDAEMVENADKRQMWSTTALQPVEHLGIMAVYQKIRQWTSFPVEAGPN